MFPEPQLFLLANGNVPTSEGCDEDKGKCMCVYNAQNTYSPEMSIVPITTGKTFFKDTECFEMPQGEAQEDTLDSSFCCIPGTSSFYLSTSVRMFYPFLVEQTHSNAH